MITCPKCQGQLRQEQINWICLSEKCQSKFPLIDGIPVLLDENRSLFSADDFYQNRRTFVELAPKNIIKKLYKYLLLLNSHNLRATANYRSMAKYLLSHGTPVKVLVLGGSVLGGGMKELLKESAIQLIETDIVFGPRTQIVCDAHALPFKDGVFDAVIAQAVLEHVADPVICVSEMYRVLRSNGLVYAETPFLQPVHGRPYDFTRFTDLGHRRLFNRFEKLDSGIVNGPGMSMALAYQFFLASFGITRWLKNLLLLFGSLTGFWLKYFDYFFQKLPVGRDMACGYYFMGVKTPGYALGDRELIKTLYP